MPGRTARILAATVAFVLLCSASAFAQGPKVAVKVAWPPGTYRMTTESDSTTELLIGEQALKSASAEMVVWELAVGAPDAKGEKHIAAKVVKYTLKEEGDTPGAYDSDAPAAGRDPDSAFVYGPLIGAPVEIVLDPDDAVIEVTGLDKLWADLSTKATTDAQKGKLAEASLELADKAVEQALRRLESIAPKKEVTQGDKWSTGIRCDYPLIGEIKQRYDCTLKAVEDAPSGKFAVVGVEARYESAKPKPGMIQGREVTVSQLDVVEKSEVKVDLASGICPSDDKSLDVKATIEATDDKSNPLTVKTTGKNRIRTTIVPAGKTAP